MYLIYLLFFKAYQTITLLDGLITLNYQFIAQYVQFELQCKTQYWCAIGFGTSLYNIDLIRISNNNNNYILIQDLQERAQTSFTIPIIDDQQDIYIVNSNVTNQYLYALFQRPLQSDDPTDAIINYYSNINMIAFINTENAEFNKYSQIQRFQLQNYQCHYSCQQCQGPQSNQCILCSNNNVQVINGYCNQTYYNNVTNFYNEQIIIKDEFILQWEYTTEDIMFQIIIFKCDWLGLGFNNDIMQNTDMVQLKFYSVTNNDGDISYYVEIDDMTGLQNMAPISDTQQYGNQDWKIDSFDYGSKLYTIRIRRKLKTEDQNDYDFTIKKDIKSIYAYGYGDQQYHNANRGAFIFELSKNQLSYSLDEWDKLVYNGHLILMFIMWSLISDIGIFYGRQLKSYPKYVKIHGMIFLFITIITYFFVFSMISQQKDKIQSLGYQSTSIILHFLLGVSILLILLFQVFLGMLARNNLESPNGTYLIYKIKYIHKYLGYFLYLLTKFQVFVGLYLISQIYVGLFFIYCILLFLVKFTIEMLYCCEVSAISRRRVKYSLIEQDQQTLYESILEKLNNGTKYQEMLDDYPKIMYIVLREAVYDISDFNHPGGQYIFKKIQGKEVGRYFYGAYPLQETQLHKHSQFAINYIETRYLGDFRNESCPLFYTQQDSTKKHSFIWTLREVKQMGNGISLFRFTDSEFKVSESFNGVQWFGRYCYIKPFGIGVDFQERPYSVVQCLSQDNIKYRFELIEYFKAQNWKNPLPQQPQLSNTIQFVIKKYNAEKNFSKFIHHNNHKRFEITGPYGFGLEMDETTKGVYYVFCQGTGVLPFLDLCDYLLKKSLFIVMNQQGLNQKSQYDQLEQFKLILCVSSKTQICGYPILQDLEYLSQQFNLNNFELNIIKRHFDKTQLSDILKYKVGRIYVCGYQSYEDEMIDLLMQCGVDNKLITQI